MAYRRTRRITYLSFSASAQSSMSESRLLRAAEVGRCGVTGLAFKWSELSKDEQPPLPTLSSKGAAKIKSRAHDPNKGVRLRLDLMMRARDAPSTHLADDVAPP